MFWTDNGWFSAAKCSACQQTERLAQIADQNRQQQEYYHQQQEYYRQQDMAIALSKIEAINRQIRVTTEQRIDVKAAYKKGYDYIPNDLPYNNSLNLWINVTEDLGMVWNNDEPYITPILNEKFKEGMRNYITKKLIPKIDYDIILTDAKTAGKEIGLGTLKSNFKLHTGLMVGDKHIYTVGFECNFKSWIEETTGTLKMTYQDPFTSEELNNQFSDGQVEAFEELNTEELKKHRLENYVVEIQQRRKKKKDLESDAFWFRIFTYLSPFVLIPWFWQSDGWVCFLLITIVTPLISWRFSYLADEREREAYNINV
jgi:hypothetical protein